MFACATHGLATFRVLFVNVLSIFVNGTFILSRNNKTLIVCTDKRLIRLKNWGKRGGRKNDESVERRRGIFIGYSRIYCTLKKVVIELSQSLISRTF